MPTAHIITRFPERAAPLRKTLADSGYRVEVLHPGQSGSRTADLEYDLDAMPEYQSGPMMSAPLDRSPIAAEIPVSEPRPRAVGKPRQFRFASKLSSLKAKFFASSRALEEKITKEREALAERNRARLVQQAEQHRLREIEAVEKRRIADAIASERRKLEAQQTRERQEAQRIAAEQAREREAKRQLELQAQLELRRREQQQVQEEARRQAQLAARGAEQQKVVRELPLNRAIEPIEKFQLSPRVASLQKAFAQKWRGLKVRATTTIREWRELSPRDRFATTRDYAWRQIIPAAAGLAIAFVFGWTLAVGNVHRGAEVKPPPTPAHSLAFKAPVAAPIATVAVTPIHTATPKPSAVKRKATVAKGKYPVSRSRRQKSDEELAAEDDEEVTVVHHRIKRDSQLIANKKAGVKTITDME